ncbi:MAG: hypothetical protein JNN04_11160 [Cyclobacteriaceae bacterium]|nr:hypothetical protein [Cyclobacteriaceae bacterium]
MTATFYNIRHRLTQVIVFVACVAICMLFAEVAEAARPKPPRFDKPKYRVSVHSNSGRVVKVLYWKRKDAPRSNNLAASSRKNRNKPQAETDF